MIGALHHPTPTELRAVTAHRAFHQKIAERAEALRAPPSPVCPHCGGNKSFARPVAFSVANLSPMARIQHIVARSFGVKAADLISGRRDHDIIRPRQIAYYFAKELTPHSWQEIGRRFGNRDHSSIFHGVRKIESLLSGDLELAAKIAALRSELESLL